MTPVKKSALTVALSGAALSLTALVINGVLAPGPAVARGLSFGISIGYGLFLFGCVLVARAKGRPWYFGLLGLLSCLGLAILWFAVKDEPTQRPA